MPTIKDTDGSTTGPTIMSVENQIKLASIPGTSPLEGWVLSDEIDLTANQTVTLMAPRTGKLARGPVIRVLITVKNGTVTTAPTIKCGTNSSNDNVAASQTPAGLSTQAANTSLSLTSVSPIPANLDMSSTGLRFQITSGAVLGTATQYKGRIMVDPFSFAIY